MAKLRVLRVKICVKLKPSQKECGLPRRDTDLVNDDGYKATGSTPPKDMPKQPILQKPRLRNLIKDPMTEVNPDKNVHLTGQFGIYSASETTSAIHSPEGVSLHKHAYKENQNVAAGKSEHIKLTPG